VPVWASPTCWPHAARPDRHGGVQPRGRFQQTQSSPDGEMMVPFADVRHFLAQDTGHDWGQRHRPSASLPIWLSMIPTVTSAALMRIHTAMTRLAALMVRRRRRYFHVRPRLRRE
jgi:hypothetical protein